VRPKRRWEDNIKTDLRKPGRDCVHCSHMTQDRDRWPAFCVHGNEPSSYIKAGESLG
jgi:hypothetical protein